MMANRDTGSNTPLRDNRDKPYKPILLVVDDEAEIPVAIADLLRRTHKVIQAHSGAEAVGILTRQDVDVILSDQRMPGMSGTELLARANELRPNAVRVLLTGYADIQAVTEAVNKSKIYFYITKPWEPVELENVIAKAVEHGRLQRQNRELLGELRKLNQDLEERVRQRTFELEKRNEELLEAYRRIEELARTDPGTGLLNRRALFELFTQHVERCRRVGSPLCAMILDLDHFKSINDRFGHATGDRVLGAVATLLMKTSRPYDLVGRYGGEEFVVVLPDVPLTSALTVAERFRSNISSLRIEEYPEPVTASFGVTGFEKDDTVETMLDRADRALYAAKQSGRNKVMH